MAETKKRGRYSYTPLTDPTSEIRLLQFLPSQHSDLICCSLKTVDLNNTPVYFAGSYEWSAPVDVEIKIDGQTAQIRHNLWLFLHWLTTAKPEFIHSARFYLWVDAICIDQMNLVEIACQVQMMGRIFHGAEVAYAWLGWTSTFDSKRTVQFITEAACALSSSEDSPYNTSPARPLEHLPSRYSERTFEKIPLEDLCRSVVRMLQLNYWSRRWIIQEIILAKKVMLVCDGQELPWLTLESLFHNLEHWISSSKFNEIDYTKWIVQPYFFEMMATVPGKMSRHRTVEQRSGFEYFMSLLKDFFETQCDSQHDKVYSFLHLVDQGARIQVDYTCSVYELFFNVVIAFNTLPSFLSSQSTSVEALTQALGIRDPYVRSSRGISKRSVSADGRKIPPSAFIVDDDDAQDPVNSIVDDEQGDLHSLNDEQNSLRFIDLKQCTLELAEIKMLTDGHPFIDDGMRSIMSKIDRYSMFKKSKVDMTRYNRAVGSAIGSRPTLLADWRRQQSETTTIELHCPNGDSAAAPSGVFANTMLTPGVSSLFICRVAEPKGSDIGFILVPRESSHEDIASEDLHSHVPFSFQILGLALLLRQGTTREVVRQTAIANISLELDDCCRLIESLQVLSKAKIKKNYWFPIADVARFANHV